MKKKVFAALCAGAMLCGMVSMPVSAWETKYTKGDINMDGRIDGKDIMAALKEYTYYFVCGLDHYLTDEQLELADITPRESTHTIENPITGVSYERTTKVTIRECHLLLMYYTYGIVDETVREKDIVDWAWEVAPKAFEK